MPIRVTKEFGEWYRALVEQASGSPKATARLVRARALLLVLSRVPGEPTVDTPELKRVAEARRHPLWRIAHPYDPAVQVRLIVWWEVEHTAWVLVGGDKAGLEGTWYTTAAVKAEQAVDRILRKRGSTKE